MPPLNASREQIHQPDPAREIVRRQVLDAMATSRSVYAIGPFSERVNFASQQMRALNLAWALTDGGPLGEGDNVAVIGAGVAGLMAAAALSKRGLVVTVYEQHHEIMPIQRYTGSRYIHPTLNYWPCMELTPAADFPVLYWCADVCSAVVSVIDRQWREEFDLPIHFGHEATGLAEEAGGVRVHFKGGMMTPVFKAVVLAVGFGLETPWPGALAPSYWDDMDPRRPGVARSGRFLVSGTGDGGVIEALRLAYDGFGEGQLTERVRVG